MVDEEDLKMMHRALKQALQRADQLIRIKKISHEYKKPDSSAEVMNPKELVEMAVYLVQSLDAYIGELLHDQIAELQQNPKSDSDDEESAPRVKEEHNLNEKSDPEATEDYELVESDQGDNEDYELVESDQEDKESDSVDDNYEEQPLRTSDFYWMISRILNNTQKQLDAQMCPVVKELSELKKKYTNLEDYVACLEQIIDSQKHDTRKCLLKVFEGVEFKNNNFIYLLQNYRE